MRNGFTLVRKLCCGDISTGATLSYSYIPNHYRSGSSSGVNRTQNSAVTRQRVTRLPTLDWERNNLAVETTSLSWKRKLVRLSDDLHLLTGRFKLWKRN